MRLAIYEASYVDDVPVGVAINECVNLTRKYEEEDVVSFVNGMCTNDAVLKDEMFADASLHHRDGAWQMIFGVCTLPEYRKRGIAGELLKAAVKDTKARGKKGLVLTCKEALLPYYAKFGFVNEGVSVSEHGGAKWYQMRISF